MIQCKLSDGKNCKTCVYWTGQKKDLICGAFGIICIYHKRKPFEKPIGVMAVKYGNDDILDEKQNIKKEKINENKK